MALDVPSVAAAVAIAFACAAVAHAAFRLVLGAVVAFARWNRQAFVLRGAPMAPGYVPLLGHTIALFKAVGNDPEEQRSQWRRVFAMVERTFRRFPGITPVVVALPDACVRCDRLLEDKVALAAKLHRVPGAPREDPPEW